MPDKPLPVIEHDVDFCVVGGGMSGIVSAIAAARHGVKTVLMHDRPFPGGNSSSECRVHVCGADRSNGIPNMRETGILEEIRLDNVRRNPHFNYSIWDTLLYEKTHFQENLSVLLNCTCLDAEMEGNHVVSVTGWQMTTQTFQKVRAKIFADCSGDGILAPLTEAEWRMGREARSEFGESIAPEQSDDLTMGMTLYFQAREHDTAQPYQAPSWAYRFKDCEELPYGAKGHQWWRQGYWWVELGGEHHSIHDTEMLRDELLRAAYGVWDHIKNSGKHDADNWALEWVQFFPAKRESRRYVGEHILNQNDVEAEGKFEDLVAYGGWTMDDHHPAGFNAVKIGAPATVFHPAPSPFGIPYRSLYSNNVANLMFAGRCASATHAAMSSTRVQGTGCSMGQALGTAAAIAVRDGLSPAEAGGRMQELQQLLLRDDAYLPWIPQEFSALTTGAELTASRGDAEPVRDGTNRPVGDDTHAWHHSKGDWIAFEFDAPREIHSATLIVDSGLDQYIQLSLTGRKRPLAHVPEVVPKDFRIEGFSDDEWRTLREVRGNHQRLVRLEVKQKVEGIRYVLDETWGAEESRLYAFYLD